jgi:tRNA pseudouridine13 synthase
MLPHVPPLRRSDLPPTGGEIGNAPEDFRVDEIPAYGFSGDGDHLLIRIEKRLLTTTEAIGHVARAAHVSPADVGSAGMKDKHAVTTQWLSLPARGARPPDTWGDLDGIRVLEVTRHRNKLRTGHLAGNRFVVRLVNVHPEAHMRAEHILETLSREGLGNYFGAQRFGRGGGNVAAALAWLRSPGKHRRDRFARKLFPSVLQSEVFNRYATERMHLGTDRPLRGDVLRLAGSNAVFLVEEPDREAPRLAARDVFLTGPMFGPRMKEATGEPGRLEGACLEALGVTETERADLGRLALGTRRDLLVFPEAVHVAPTEAGIEVAFTLPAGSYATQVVRELTRAPFLAAGPPGRAYDGPFPDSVGTPSKDQETRERER